MTAQITCVKLGNNIIFLTVIIKHEQCACDVAVMKISYTYKNVEH